MPFLIPLIASLAGGALSAGGSALGNALSQPDREEQQRLLEQALAQYQNLSVPELQKLMAEQLGPSAMEGVQGQMDPRLAQSQMDVLEGYKRLENGGGNDAETNATMARILGQAAQSATTNRNAAINSMHARGAGGSGAELAAMLQGNQAASQNAYDSSVQAAGQAQQRMLQAMQNRAGLAGQVRNQQYGELSDAAKAKDMINRYNADARYRAQTDNNSRLAQTYAMNEAKARGTAGLLTQNSQAAGQRADDTRGMWSGIGQGAGQAATGLAGAYMNDAQRTDDRDFLRSLYQPTSSATSSNGYGYQPDPSKDDPYYYLRKP